MANEYTDKNPRRYDEDFRNLSPNCINEPELFITPDHENASQKKRREKLAKELCRSCEMREPCLEDAYINHGIGIRGGKTEEERKYDRR